MKKSVILILVLMIGVIIFNLADIENKSIYNEDGTLNEEAYNDIYNSIGQEYAYYTVENTINGFKSILKSTTNIISTAVNGIKNIFTYFGYNKAVRLEEAKTINNYLCDSIINSVLLKRDEGSIFELDYNIYFNNLDLTGETAKSLLIVVYSEDFVLFPATINLDHSNFNYDYIISDNENTAMSTAIIIDINDINNLIVNYKTQYYYKTCISIIPLTLDFETSSIGKELTTSINSFSLEAKEVLKNISHYQIEKTINKISYDTYEVYGKWE